MRTAWGGVIAAAAAAAVAKAAILADTPYVEIESTRRPFAGTWQAQALPTGWSPLPSVASISTLLATTVRSRGVSVPTVLAATGSGTLIDLVHNDTVLTLAGASEPISAAWRWTALPAGLFTDATLSAVAVSPTAAYAAACDVDAGACTLTKFASHGVGAPVGVPLAYAAPAGAPDGVAYLWVLGAAGTAAFGVAADLTATLACQSPAVYAAAAHSAANAEVALGNETAVMYFTPSTPLEAVYFDWVTDVVETKGAPIDDVVTALAYAPGTYASNGGDAGLPAGVAERLRKASTGASSAGASGSGNGNGGDILYAANPTCLNARLPGTRQWVRLGGSEGLPYGNLTALGIDTRTDYPGARAAPRLWLGGAAGVALFDPSAPAGQGTGLGAVPHGSSAASSASTTGRRWRRSNRRVPLLSPPLPSSNAASAAAGSPVTVPLAQQWRYFYGPRYLPSTPSDAFGVGGTLPGGTTAIASVGNTTFVLTGAGVAVLTAQEWTLAAKAAFYESLLPRHDRLGMVAECYYPSFGVTDPCTSGPSANNGLWTALVVTALSFKYAVTQDAADAAAAWRFFGGMKLLNDVTGIPGLMGRSAVGPGTPFPGQDWYNSTALPGYAWYLTASSDEVVGHLFAYPIMAALGVPAGNATARAEVLSVLTNIATYITRNNFTLVDITGQPSQWGHWEPAILNVNRDWSDGRGINSLEILALTTCGMSALAADSPAYDLLAAGRDTLTSPANDYQRNMVNARVNAPCDVNFSDDELEWFSYFPLLFSANATRDATVLAAAAASLQRSWVTGVQSQRASVWAAMYLAMTSSTFPAPLPADAGSDPAALATAADVAWNLRTWGLELTDWPAHNSHRLDITFDPDADRFGSLQATRVLPQNERRQGRWNADPFGLDDGSGTQEDDPGAWLLPYWLARYYGIIGGA
jgi:hypothetical protein